MYTFVVIDSETNEEVVGPIRHPTVPVVGSLVETDGATKKVEKVTLNLHLDFYNNTTGFRYHVYIGDVASGGSSTRLRFNG